jgi:trigger factor
MSMEFTETSTAGLKREYRVIVPASDLEARVNERLDDLKNRVQLRGFRPGKVPVAHLKRLYGKSAMAEVIEATVNEANSKIIADKKLKLAIEPKVVLPTEQSDVERVIEGKSDLAYTVEMEIVPPITLVDFKSLKLTRLTAEVTDEEIDQAVKTIAEQNKPFVAKTDSAANGDRVTMSFEGSIAGVPFEGGKGTDVPLLLGSGQFIPGFEEHLLGVKAGENKAFDVKFPDDYRATALAGKDATFAVTVSAVETPGEVKIDDHFAKALGLESLAKLKDAG